MKLALAFLLMSVVACAANVGTSGVTYVPKDAAATCSGYCNEMGLQLNSVVVMASNVGCVCSPAMPPSAAPPGAAPAAPTAAPAASGAAGGMAALIVAEEARRSQQAQQQQHH